jgi:hypothetical protein
MKVRRKGVRSFLAPGARALEDRQALLTLFAHASHSSRENQQPANTPARGCHRVPSDSAEAPRIVPLGLDAR